MDDVFDFNQTPVPFKSETVPKAMPCAKQVTNPAGGADGMRELIRHDGGVPE
jgi:hypothetical protein